MKELTKINKEIILHAFFKITLSDFRTGETKEIHYDEFNGSLINYQHIDCEIETDNDCSLFPHSNAINISKMFDVFQEMMKHKDEYESIKLIWDEDYDYKSFYRIVGVRLETDEEFELRKKGIAEEIERKAAAKLEKQQKILDRKKEKLAKLKLELGES